MRDLLVRRIDQCFGFASAGRSDVYLNKQTNKQTNEELENFLATSQKIETARRTTLHAESFLTVHMLCKKR